MRTHRIYSLNNFPTYHTAVLAIVMSYITKILTDITKLPSKEGYNNLYFHQQFVRVPVPTLLSSHCYRTFWSLPIW